MSFFEPKPPSKPSAPTPEPSPWFQEPRRVLGGTVGIRVLLASTPTVAVFAYGFVAFPEGVSFTIGLRPRARSRRRDPKMDFDLVMNPRYTDGELSPSFFRFGIEFEDGTRLTNLTSDEERRELSRTSDPPNHPVLQRRGGGGSDREFDLSFWLWPLPEDKTIDLVCEWPVVGVSVSRTTIETAPMLAAASRARPYWGRET